MLSVTKAVEHFEVYLYQEAFNLWHLLSEARPAAKQLMTGLCQWICWWDLRKMIGA